MPVETMTSEPQQERQLRDAAPKIEPEFRS